jgi:hypothetical protein
MLPPAAAADVVTSSFSLAPAASATTIAETASGDVAKAVAHHADASTAIATSSSSSSTTPSASSSDGPRSPIASAAAAAPHAPTQTPTPSQAAPGEKTTLAQVIDIQVLPDGSEQALPLSAEQSALMARLKRGRYGEVAGGDENVADIKPAALRVRHMSVDGSASDDLWQIDSTLADATVAVFTLPSAVKEAQAIGDQVVTEQSMAKKGKAKVVAVPMAAAGLTATSAEIRSSASRNFLAAAAAGTVVVAVQLHQWRKRKLAAAASKLATLLQFDPLAVWLDGDRDRGDRR